MIAFNDGVPKRAILYPDRTVYTAQAQNLKPKSRNLNPKTLKP